MKKSSSLFDRRSFLKTVGQGSALIAGTSLMGAPAIHAKKKIRWKMVTTWPKNFPGLGTGANFLAKKITEMSGGELVVKVFGGGELVPALGVFDAVSRGTAQMGHSAPYYWKSKHEATQIFGAVPFGLNSREMSGWLQFGGGQQLWDQLYDKFGLVAFSAGDTGVQMGGWYNKEIKKSSDFKGLKMRMPGLGGEVLRKLGATVVTLPGGEIFQSLKTGAIDAAEWVGPYNDLAFGFPKAAKYYYWPGWHEPSANIECMINKKAYLQLSRPLQAIVKAACGAAHQNMMAEFAARNSQALSTLTKKHKVKVQTFPKGVLKKLGKKSDEVMRELAGKDSFTQKVFRSYDQFRNDSIHFGQITEEGYSIARALTYGKK